MIEMECPYCSHQLRMHDKFAGRRGGCKYCRGIFVVAPAGSSNLQGTDTEVELIREPSLEPEVPDWPDDLPGDKRRTPIPERAEVYAASTIERAVVENPYDLGGPFWALTFLFPPAALIWAATFPRFHRGRRMALVSSGAMSMVFLLLVGAASTWYAIEAANAALADEPAAPVDAYEAALAALTAMGKTCTLDGMLDSIREGDLETVGLYLDCGVNVNAEDAVGATPLTLALTDAEFEDIAYLLLDSGADVDVRGLDGKTPLQLAVQMGERGNTGLVKALLNLGANPNGGPPAKVVTPLMLAAQQGNSVMVEDLVGAGASVSRVDAAGATALMYAARRGDHAMVQAMLDAGAREDKRDATGYAARDYARSAGHTDLAELL